MFPDFPEFPEMPDYNADEDRKEKRRRYIVMVMVLGAVMVFGITLIVRTAIARSKAKEPAQPVLSTEVLTEPVLQSEALTEAPETVSAETEAPTEPETEAETEPETEAPTETVPPGNLQCSKTQVYVRVNHTQEVVLRLSGGLKQSDIVWSCDDYNIADVENGKITGLSKGTCTVIADAGEERIEIPVTVRALETRGGCTYVDGILVANKSYSLPSDYEPGVLPVTMEAFEALSEDAAKEGLDIHVGSDFRTYDYQVTVYNSMVKGYGRSYADQYSARPGHSEHQTGYTIDCNSINNEDFADTPEGKWLEEHCHEYGFIIRYPKGKEAITGYGYESWHIRYVGVEHATNIYEQGLTLEEYLDITSSYEDDVCPHEDE